MRIFDRFFNDVAIDLGTANSVIYLKNRGIVINEPTVAAVNNKTNQILSVGEEAKRMMGRTPTHITVIRPLVNGVISDFEMARDTLRQFLHKLGGSVFSVRNAVVGIPNNLTEVERKSVEDAILNAGVSKVYLVESPIASALGAAMPIGAPTASFIVDIGGGTTDIAVIAMGGTVISKTLKIAGDRFNDEIMKFVRDEFKIAIGEPTAEAIKIAAGSAIPWDERLEIAVRGRDYSSGLPKEVMVKNTHVRAALHKPLKTIVETIREVITMTPPELAGDMLKQGIYVCGGGALLRGIDQLIQKETSVITTIVEDPLTCLPRGLGRIVDNMDHYKGLLDNPLRPLAVNL